MAAIREELEIVDMFSAQFARFLTLGNKMLEAMERIDESSRQMADSIAEAGEKASKSYKDSDKSANDFLSTVKKLAAAVGGIAAVKGAISLSDDLSIAQARINAITGDLEKTAQAQNAIYEAAQRSRTSYTDMMGTVAKLKSQTGDMFANIEEATAFTELLNKQFKISGTDAQGVQSVMYNLTQAMSTGVLRGQDLNSVFQNSPQLVQRIADKMGQPIGKIKELAEQGAITADIVKSAVMDKADEINKQFNAMPMTFGDAMQKMKNIGIKAFQPLGQMIANVVNSPRFAAAMDGIAMGIQFAAAVGTEAFRILGAAADFVCEHLDVIAPVVGVVAAAFAIYKAQAMAAAAAQWVLNAATAAWPGFLVVMQIAAIIGAITAAVMAFHMFAATGHTVFGDLAGIINVVIQFFVNLGLTVANIALGIGNAIGALASNMMSAFSNAISSVQGWFYDLLSTAASVIAGIARELNKLPFVEFDFSGIESAANDYAAKSAAAYANQKGYEDVGAAFSEGLSTFDAFKSGWAENAFEAGAAWGDSVQNTITDGFSSLAGSVDSFSGGASFGDLLSGQNNISNALGADGTGKANVGSVDKVKKIEDCKLSDEDLKIYRDLAERRFMANVELQTLAPNISVSIPESAAKNLTAQDIADKLKVLLIEQSAAHTAVSHA